MPRMCTKLHPCNARANSCCLVQISLSYLSHIGYRDVAYVSASGSVVASAGYSSNGANVVIWDTLSPPATSQTSIMCHEGMLLNVSNAVLFTV